MINRDGFNPSLWQATVEEYKSISIFKPEEVFDVAIVGGGITGVSTALLLQEAGKKCILFESNNLGYGTTGGTTAHLNTLLDTPYALIEKNFNEATSSSVAKATELAIELIHTHINRFSIDCGWQKVKASLYARNEKQAEELQEILDACLRAGLPAKRSEELPLDAIESIDVDDQAKFHPLKYIQAIALEYEKAGGVLLQKTLVTGVKENETLEISTSVGTIRARDVIYATHIPPGINVLHLRCAPYRTYVLAVTLKDNKYPSGLIYDMDDPYQYYRSQEIDGQRYLIAGGKDHKTGSEDSTASVFTKLEATVRKVFDVDSVDYKWSSQYYESNDGLPYIGNIPGLSNHIYAATGFGGNGMVYSQIAAMIFRSLLVDGSSSLIDPALFNPGRLKPVAGFTSFFSHNADVLKNFAGKLFSGEKMKELADLAPGEGKMVKYEQEKLGIYKDPQGNLFGIHPACTHMKCEVKWNGAERSWDCPCHGARFGIHGEVLNGPAVHDLEKVNIASLTNEQ